MTPGIHSISNAAYHAGPGISKSGLWKLWNETPAAFRYAQDCHTPSTKAQDFGSAAHVAILEPELFEAEFARGPDARGNSNAWKESAAIASFNGMTLLKPADYDAVLYLRDEARKNPIIRQLTSDAQIEQAAYWKDEETGELCRCKPDVYSRKHGLIGDIKTTTCAAREQWTRRLMDFGYHVQEPYYSDGWQIAGGGPVNGFVFIVVESTAPHLIAAYELDPDSAEEGRQIYRAALRLYADCKRSGNWPGYADKIQELRLPKWAFRFTAPDLEAAE